VCACLCTFLCAGVHARVCACVHVCVARSHGRSEGPAEGQSLLRFGTMQTCLSALSCSALFCLLFIRRCIWGVSLSNSK